MTRASRKMLRIISVTQPPHLSESKYIMHAWQTVIILVVLAWIVWKLLGPKGKARSGGCGCGCGCGGPDKEEKSSGSSCCCGGHDAAPSGKADEQNGVSRMSAADIDRKPSSASGAAGSAAGASAMKGGFLFSAGLGLGLLVAAAGLLGLFGPGHGYGYGYGYGYGHGHGFGHGFSLPDFSCGLFGFSGHFGVSTLVWALLLAVLVGLVVKLTQR